MPEYAVARQPFVPAQDAPMMQRVLYGILNMLYGSEAIKDAPLDMMMPLGGMARQVGKKPIEWLYHGANAAGTKAIKKSGKIGGHAESVFLTPNRAAAAEHAKAKGGEVFRVNKADIPTELLEGMGTGPIAIPSWGPWKDFRITAAVNRGNRVGPIVNDKLLPMARTAPVSPTAVSPFELMQLGLSKGAPPWKMGSK